MRRGFLVFSFLVLPVQSLDGWGNFGGRGQEKVAFEAIIFFSFSIPKEEEDDWFTSLLDCGVGGVQRLR
jgi:hypothetical protein